MNVKHIIHNKCEKINVTLMWLVRVIRMSVTQFSIPEARYRRYHIH